MDKEIYYSPEDIAQKFNLKADSVRKWIREGKLKGIKLGRMWRVSEAELNRFIQDSAAETTQARG